MSNFLTNLIALPIELIEQISLYDIKVYRTMILLVKKFGKYSLNPFLNKIYQNKFIVMNETDKEIIYSLNNRKHRLDGPAVIYKPMPSVSLCNGLMIVPYTKTYIKKFAYYKNNKLHRDDGPAVERANGILEWWINGKMVKRINPTEV